jgi:hypothetical protein
MAPVVGFRTTFVELGVPEFTRPVWYGVCVVVATAADANPRTGPATAKTAPQRNDARRRLFITTYFKRNSAEYSPIQMTSTKCQ